MSEFSKCLFLVNTNTQTEAKTKEISWVKALKNVPLAATWWSFGFQCDESTETLSQQLAMSNGHRRQCVESCGIKTWLWLVWLLATGKLPTGVFTFKCFTMFYHPRFDYLGYPMASPTHLELLQCWSGFPWLRRFFFQSGGPEARAHSSWQMAPQLVNFPKELGPPDRENDTKEVGWLGRPTLVPRCVFKWLKLHGIAHAALVRSFAQMPLWFWAGCWLEVFLKI